MASRSNRLRSVPDPPADSSANQSFTESKLRPRRLPKPRLTGVYKALGRLDRAIETMRTANAAFHFLELESEGKAVDGAALACFDEGLHRAQRAYSRLDTKISRLGRARHSAPEPLRVYPDMTGDAEVDRMRPPENGERSPSTIGEREYIAARWPVEQGTEEFAKVLEDDLVRWLMEDPQNIRAYVLLVRVWMNSRPLRLGSEVSRLAPVPPGEDSGEP